MTYRRKLIEVALPLEAINMESAREKSIRHGHPSTLHLWWARRPLAACRAVLWASLVDDPSSWPDRFPTEEDQKQERQRLFDILGRITIETDKKGNTKPVVRGLVSWDEVNDPKSKVLESAQREIARCLAWDRGEEPPTKPEAVRQYIAKYAPPAYDPFAGGGSIPLEAQRLGLEAHASDLNPVAVLINKALIEIPPKFKDQAPVNPEDCQKKGMSSWKGAQGLATDVRFYGAWMRERAFERIGYLYPKVKNHHRGTEDTESTVIAWLWARTVKCSNPACGIHTPLLSSFVLSSKKGKENYLLPKVIGKEVSFKITQEPPMKWGDPKKGLKRGMSGVFECIACGTITTRKYVAEEATAKRLGSIQTAVVVEGKSGRGYLPPEYSPCPDNIPAVDKTGLEAELSPNPRDVWCRNFGLNTPADLFTSRQLVALTTFSDLVGEAREKAIADAVAAGLADDDVPLNDGGTGARAYGDAISTYLAFATNKLAEASSTICTWSSSPKNELVVSTFRRQAIPMTWDFAEANIFSESSGSLNKICNFVSQVIEKLPSGNLSSVKQINASINNKDLFGLSVSTDPPYYDNIGYADLSDFFYVWLRRSLQSIYPNLFSTLLVPKAQELVATPYRFDGNKQKAQEFFEEGLGKAFNRMHEISHADYPLTVYYAFKQAESESDGEGNDDSIASTGWETMLEGLIQSQFTIDGTWPIRTERTARSISIGTNALASSIVLVCRPRPTNAAKITRRQFLTELKRELPQALKTLQQGNVAPVDLAQASIGPGMAVFSQYAAVLENDGTPMRVRTALQLINQILDEFLTEQEGEFDGDTRWALTWFEQHQFDLGQYGDAETLSKAKNTSVQGLVDAGILEAKGGKVRLLKRSELESDWNPDRDGRTPDWEIGQHLIHTLDQQGEMGAAQLLAKLGGRGEMARDLAYRLYSLCDRKGWTQEAIAYNSLVISWPEISRLASDVRQSEPIQPSLL
jgi:putative DNA methylase